MSKQNEMLLLLGQGMSLTAAATEQQINIETVRRWLNEGQFAEMLTKIRRLVTEIRAKLTEAGVPTELLDDEVADQIYEWALVAGLSSPRPIPPARPTTHHPYRRLEL